MLKHRSNLVRRSVATERLSFTAAYIFFKAGVVLRAAPETVKLMSARSLRRGRRGLHSEAYTARLTQRGLHSEAYTARGLVVRIPRAHPSSESAEPGITEGHTVACRLRRKFWISGTVTFI